MQTKYALVNKTDTHTHVLKSLRKKRTNGMPDKCSLFLLWPKLPQDKLYEIKKVIVCKFFITVNYRCWFLFPYKSEHEILDECPT